MINWLHNFSITALIIFPATGVAIGQAIIAKSMAAALNTQPSEYKKLSNLYIIALAIAETSAILSLLVGMLLFLSHPITIGQSLSSLAIVLALAIPSAFTGIACALPVRTALKSAARYPFAIPSILQVMLLGMSVLQTPVILGLITALIIKNNSINTVADGYRMIAIGLAFSLGSIGPSIGLSSFSQKVCDLLGRYPHSYHKMVAFIFTSLALIETPLLLIFINGILMFVGHSFSTTHESMRYIAASIALGLSTLGAGISSGRTAASSASVIAQRPEHADMVSRNCLLSQTLIDTGPIYGLIVAILLILTT